eukprot:gene33169-43660_t
MLDMREFWRDSEDGPAARSYGHMLSLRTSHPASLPMSTGS